MINLIGIPHDANSSFLRGPSLAPQRIRLAGVDGSSNPYSECGIEILEGINYLDIGDIQFDDSDSEKAFHNIKETIGKQLTNNSKILSLGGDHFVTWPIIEAYSEKFPDLNILHLDAHADLYQNFDNNPYSHASPFARIMEKGKIKSLTQVGIRTLNSHQREQAQRFGVKMIEMKDFNFDFVQSLQAPLYISLDLDVFDPAFAPGISHHEPGGLSTREILKIIQSINTNIVGADIVEYNPVRDLNNTTAMLAYKLMKELMAKMME
jgi:arginase